MTNKEAFFRWIDVIILTFLITFLLLSLEYFKIFKTPLTFSFLWLFTPLVVGYFYIKIRNVTYKEMFYVVFMCFFLSIISIFFHDNDVHTYPFHHRYIGIFTNIADNGSIDEEGHPTYNTPFVNRGAYYVNDFNLNKIIKDLQRNNKIVDGEIFLFWQTAYDKGYTPVDIKNFEKPNDFLSQLEYFFTIGPVVLLESILCSLKFFFINLICFLLIHIYIKKMGYQETPYKVPWIFDS